MTYQLYDAIKQNKLQQVPAIGRSYVNTYFEWLKKLEPTEVVDAIEQNKTVEQAYKELGISPLRMAIAAARGFLKVSKTYQQKLKETATPELALMTLKFENPTTYAVIQRYGERGNQYLKQWVNGALKILGVT
jgi:hypothetical protein